MDKYSNIKMYLKEIVYEDMDQIDAPQNSDGLL
jgi:hypothetical protein